MVKFNRVATCFLVRSVDVVIASFPECQNEDKENHWGKYKRTVANAKVEPGSTLPELTSPIGSSIL